MPCRFFCPKIHRGIQAARSDPVTDGNACAAPVGPASGLMPANTLVADGTSGRTSTDSRLISSTITRRTVLSAATVRADEIEPTVRLIIDAWWRASPVNSLPEVQTKESGLEPTRKEGGDCRARQLMLEVSAAQGDLLVRRINSLCSAWNAAATCARRSTYFTAFELGRRRCRPATLWSLAIRLSML